VSAAAADSNGITPIDAGVSEAAEPVEGGRYPHVVRAVFETPWAILPSYLQAIAELVELRAGGGQLSQEEISARIGSGPATRAPATAGAVAVIPIYGVIMPRATLLSQISGGCSLATISQQLQAALDDPQVSSILLDVCSPGGSTALVPETAALIAAANKQKPVTAIANNMAASAAYFLACQAGELYVTPSGYVGSIGVYAVHQDISGALAQAGVAMTMISAGKYKTEGNNYEPLSADAESALQALIDDAYNQFFDAVAQGRGVSTADVRGGFGEGRVVTAAASVKANMADGVATFDEVLQQMLATPTAPAGNARADADDIELASADLGAMTEMTELLRQTASTLSTHSLEGTDEQ
jgi:capsid assembly protease